MISDFDRRTPVTTGPRPDREAEQKASRFGLLCIGDIQRALTATYAHRPPEERAEYLAQDLHGAVGLAIAAAHYGRIALDQREQDRRRSEGKALLKSVLRQQAERRRLLERHAS